MSKKKNHDGTDREPLVATFEEAEAHWRKGVKAHVVLDLDIPTGDGPSEDKKRLPPDLDYEIPF